MDQLLQALTRNGVLLSVSVRYWRAHKQLKPEDIGLEPDQVSARLISLGHKRLLPKEATAAMALVESRAHALVEANTFPFLNGLTHFLPNTKLEEVTGKLKELAAEFWKAEEKFIEHYARLRDDSVGEWRSMARKLSADPDRLIATIEASFPPVARLERFFGFETQLFQIAVPERLGLDLVSEESQQQLVAARQQASQEAAHRIRQETERFVADCVASLREQTATLCHEMLESIRTSETGVHQKTLNRLVKFIDRFREMNFAGDADMERQLDAVRQELLTRTAEEYRDSATARQRLVGGLTRLAEEARQMAKQDATELVQRFGGMGRRKFHLAA